MNDGSLALQVWALDKLKQTAGVIALVGSRVFGARPPQTVAFPYILAEDSDALPFGRGNDQGCSVTMTFHAYARAADKVDAVARAREAANEIAKALSNQRPTIDGWSVAYVFVERTSAVLERDTATAHSLVQVRADMWPLPS